jgi:hypothetical protein
MLICVAPAGTFFASVKGQHAIVELRLRGGLVDFGRQAHGARVAHIATLAVQDARRALRAGIGRLGAKRCLPSRPATVSTLTRRPSTETFSWSRLTPGTSSATM